MDIVSPKTLWRDYDRKELPLDVTVISDRRSCNEHEQRVYFNGMPETGACARIFARLVMPDGGINLPVCIVMRDAEYPVEEADSRPFTDRGYAVLFVDYTGKREGAPFTTIYPEALGYADFTNECLTKAPRDPRNNCWIVWAKVLLRALTYAESVEALDASKAAVIGEGVSSGCVWKACVAEEGIACGISLFGSRFSPDGVDEGRSDEDDSAYLGYEAALMKASYAPFIKVPMLVMTSTNDCDDSLDHISEAYSLIPKTAGCRFSISERMNRAIGYKQRGDFWQWIDSRIKGEGNIPPEPALTASCSCSKLYFEVTAEKNADIELFISQAMEHPSMRNWHSGDLIKTGQGQYICRQDVYDITKPVYAFANMYSEGFSFSSPVIAKSPAAMGVTPSPVKLSRLIYDGEMGVDDWTVYQAAQVSQAEMVKGPFDIEGVSAAGGSLMTYKLADVNYRGGDGDILQVCLYSGSEQEVTFSVVKKEEENGEARFVTYRTTVALSPGDNWRRINLKPSLFISDGGVCQNWEGIVCLKLSGNAPVVKSVLWV